MSEIQVGQINSTDGSTAITTGAGGTVTLSAALTGTDATLSGGVYLGGTGAANYLDDYEEGTFTATFADASSGGTTTTVSAVGTYTKVGNTVTIIIHITGMNTTGMTSGNNVHLQGMPFAAPTPCWGSVRLSGITFSGFVTAQINDSYIRLRENLSGSSNFIPVSDVTDDDGQIYVTMTYIAS